MEIRFGEIYTVTTKETRVTTEGRYTINRVLQDAYEASLPCNWDWKWMVGKGKYRGGLPKRVAGFFKRQYDIKISSETRTFVGNVARRNCHFEKNYIFDFTKCFDWLAGDFGDHDSCYWTVREPAREVLMCNGVFAIRFYREDSTTGFARAWIMRIHEGLVVFNAYGLPCKTIAYVLSTLLNKPYPSKISVRVSGDPSELIWLNGDAHVIADADIVGLSTIFDFDVPFVHCDCCNEFVHTERYYYGEEMCERCYKGL